MIYFNFFVQYNYFILNTSTVKSLRLQQQVWISHPSFHPCSGLHRVFVNVSVIFYSELQRERNCWCRLRNDLDS